MASVNLAGALAAAGKLPPVFPQPKLRFGRRSGLCPCCAAIVSTQSYDGKYLGKYLPSFCAQCISSGCNRAPRELSFCTPTPQPVAKFQSNRLYTSQDVLDLPIREVQTLLLRCHKRDLVMTLSCFDNGLLLLQQPAQGGDANPTQRWVVEYSRREVAAVLYSLGAEAGKREDVTVSWSYLPSSVREPLAALRGSDWRVWLYRGAYYPALVAQALHLFSRAALGASEPAPRLLDDLRSLRLGATLYAEGKGGRAAPSRASALGHLVNRAGRAVSAALLRDEEEEATPPLEGLLRSYLEKKGVL